MRLTTRQRRDKILTELYDQQHVTATALAEVLSVSTATVRRDLRVLAEAGRLEQVYGGATLPRNGDYSFHAKAGRNVEAKRIVGRLAAELVADGEQLFIDSGTTCFEMVPYLKRKRGLSVIANSARVALELDTPKLNVILLGGQYRPDRMDTVGPLATAALEQLRGYSAFIGADGLSMEFGLTASDIASAHLYRLAVCNAQKTVLLVDHTKFLAPSLCRIVDWDAICRVVTDRPPVPRWMAFLQEKGIEITYPAAHAGQQVEEA
ncbi:MAG: DeoR/GlpR transcriptional regulator [Planctomycetes bacterium]|nr:DeoR/GlpR transcriptional regulator [Planctomycetota bacterium]